MGKILLDKKRIRNLYENELLTIREIAGVFSISTSPIAKIVKELGISRNNIVIRDVKKYLLSRIEKKESGCWEYNYSIQNNGYSRIWNKKAHRVAYEVFNNKKINDGMTIDHLCKNKTCINPEHLEEVSQGENTLRGNSWSGINSRKTHCKRGHLLSGDNLAIYAGKRQCRECFRLRQKKYNDK